jgi:hypothetical protein
LVNNSGEEIKQEDQFDKNQSEESKHNENQEEEN